MATLTDATRPAGGYLHSLVSLTDGTAHAWGSNSSGQLGVSGGASCLPVEIDGLDSVLGGSAGTGATVTYTYDGDGVRHQVCSATGRCTGRGTPAR